MSKSRIVGFSLAFVFLALAALPMSMPVMAVDEEAVAIGPSCAGLVGHVRDWRTSELAARGKAIGLQPPGYPVTVDIEPDTLNLNSRGQWITAYIESPSVDPATIERSTLRLNGQVPASPSPSEVGDYDADGIWDLMVKFARDAIYPLIMMELEYDPHYLDGPIEMTVTGVSPMVGPITGTDWIFINCWRWSKDFPVNRIQSSISVTTFQTPNQVGSTWWTVTAVLKNPLGAGIPNKTLKFYWRWGQHTGVNENCVQQVCPVNMVTNAAGTTSISVGFAIGGNGSTTHVDVTFGGDCFYTPSSTSSAPINH